MHISIIAKDIDCKLANRQIRISYRPTEVIYIEGTLEEAVSSEDSVWTISSDSEITQLIYTIGKARNTWWKYGRPQHIISITMNCHI